MSPQIIAMREPVPEGCSCVFTYKDSIGFQSEGIVIRRNGRLFAYKNICRHQPRPLDFGDGTFMTRGDEYLECCHHGAVFRCDTGLCVSGPCEGASLFSLPVTETDGVIEVTIPPDDEAFELE